MRKFIFCFAAVTFILIAMEALVRIAGLGKTREESLFTDIYDISYELMPNALNPWSDVQKHINSQGFRGRDVPQTRTTGVARIICLGDSTTFGSGVNEEQTYSYILESRLRSRGMKVEVLNAGIPGVNLWQQTLYYERRLSRWRPDLLILYSTPNFRPDLFDMRRHLEARPWELPVKRGLARSHLYRLLRRLIKPPTLNRVWSQHVAEFSAPDGLVIRREQALTDTISDLRRLDDLCRKGNGRLAAVGVLARNVIQKAKTQGISVEHPGWRDFYSDGNLSSQITIAAESMGIATIHPENEFLRRWDEAVYFSGVVHFTAAGHALMADVLEREILSAGWLPYPSGSN